MDVMGTRLNMLEEAYKGLETTGVSLVAYRDGKPYGAGFTDDIGTYAVIPKLAQWLELSIPQAINVFYYSVICVSLVIGLMGVYFLYENAKERIIAFFGVFAIALYSAKIGDVYVFAPCAAMSMVPWLLYAIRRPSNTKLFIWLAPIGGFLIGTLHFMRSHSGTAVALFMLVLLIFKYRGSVKDKTLVCCAMMGAMAIPVLAFGSLVRRSEHFIKTQDAQYESGLHKHPFWHSVYIGLGFVRNPYVTDYKDEVAVAKVKSIDPSVGYVTKEYEAILKREVLKIRNFSFWITNFGAKTGVVLFYFLVFANAGLILRMVRGGFDYDLPFLAALLFSALPGILVVPDRDYLVGLNAFALLYNTMMVNSHLFRRNLSIVST